MSNVTEPIEIVQNLKTNAWFVLLEELPGERFRVVNPNGDSLSLPSNHFSEDIEVVEGDEALQRLTSAQIASFNRFNREMEVSVSNLMRKQAEAQAASSRPASASSGETTPRKRKQSKVELPKSYYEAKTPRVSWQGAKLTFYRHHIDPLKGHHKFSINVVGTGIFEMTKDQFMSSFSEIILSTAYKSNGLYSYDTVPEKALRYLKK